MGYPADSNHNKRLSGQYNRMMELGSLFKLSPIGIIIEIKEGDEYIISDANPTACRMLGYSKKDLTYIPAIQIFRSEEEKDDISKKFSLQFKELGMASGETVLKKQNGEDLPVILSMSRIDPDDSSFGYILNIIDISEQKRIERDLRKAHKESDLLIDHYTQAEELGGVSSFSIDLINGFLWGSRKYFEIYEWKSNGAGTVPVSEYQKFGEKIFFEDDGQFIHWSKKFKNFIDFFNIDPDSDKQEEYTGDFFIKQKNGNYLPVRNKLTPIKKDGKIVELKGTLADISKEYLQRKELTESMRRLQNMERISGSGSWELFVEDQKILVSENLSSIFRKQKHEIKLELSDLFHKVDAIYIVNEGKKTLLEEEEFIEKLLNPEELISEVNDKFYQNEIICKSGRNKIHLQNYYYPLLENGKIKKITGISRDITEEKKFESEMIKARKNAEENEKKISSIFNVAPVGIGVVKNRIFTEINQRTCELLGYNREELLGKSAQIIYPTKDEFDRIADVILPEVIKSGQGKGEARFKKKSGENVNVLLAFLMLDKKDISKGLIFAFFDITETKKIEKELIKARERAEESEKKISNLFNIAPVGIAVIKNRKFTEVNKSICDLTGYSREELIDRDVRCVYPTEEEYHQVGESLYENMQSSDLFVKETRLQRKDGVLLHIVITMAPMDRADREKGFLIAIYDISEIKESQEAIRRSEELLRITFQSIEDALITTDNRGRIINMNPVAEEFVDKKLIECENKLLSEVMSYRSEEDMKGPENLVDYVLQTGMSIKRVEEFILVNQGGGEHRITDSGSPIRDGEGNVIGVVLVFRDVSKETQLRQQLIQSQKMETVGTLAGGIAHDFNNMLGGILGSTEILGRYLPDDEEAKTFYDLIITTCERASRLVDKLLTFSRKEDPDPSVLDIHRAIENTAALLRNTVDKRIDIRLELNAQKSDLLGDPAQIETSLINLGINAAHAMPEGGTLSFVTTNVELDDMYCDLSSFHPVPGNYIKVEVIDTGSGISPEDRGKIFEPFFSTKEVGKGTGLGLAIVYGTMKSHHGSVSLISELGKGSEFQLFFPVASETSRWSEESFSFERKGEGTILFVDDEEIMRVTVETKLKELGYTVITAKDGLDALDIFEKSHGLLDLIILDMVMPRLNGRDFLKKIRETDKDIKVILSSGFAERGDVEEMEKMGLVRFIQKPYRVSELSGAVFDALH